MDRRALHRHRDPPAGPAALRGRERQRVPLRRPAGRRAQPGHRHLPIGGDRRHPGRGPRGQAPGRPGGGGDQRGGQRPLAGGRRRPLHAVGAGDLRARHQDAGGPDGLRPARSRWRWGPRAARSRSNGTAPWSPSSGRSRAGSAAAWSSSRSSPRWPSATPTSATRSTSRAGSTSPPRRGGPQAQGGLLHPRRGLRGRGAQARSDRAPRRRGAGGGGGHPLRHPGQDAQQHRRGALARRAGDRPGHRGRRRRGPRPGPRPGPGPRLQRAGLAARQRRARSSSSPITWRSSAAATWTSRATSPSR